MPMSRSTSRAAWCRCRSGRAFDRTYIDQQARSDARTLALYDAYAKSGDNAQGRKFAT